MLWCLVLLVLLAARAPAAGERRSLEYQVKAAFLYNFARFTEWPDDAVGGQDAPFVLGILGEDPFGNNLEQTVSGKQVNDRPLVIRRGGTLEDIGPCHILFVSESENRRLTEILAGVASRPVLTVGESDDFTQRGGMIRLLRKADRVRFEIKARVAERAGLKISSKLLRLADNYRDTRD